MRIFELSIVSTDCKILMFPDQDLANKSIVRKEKSVNDLISILYDNIIYRRSYSPFFPFRALCLF